MDPPPKKQHLTRQLLMEITQKEGLRWEADLVAYLSEFFSTFYCFFQLLVTSVILEKATKYS